MSKQSTEDRREAQRLASAKYRARVGFHTWRKWGITPAMIQERWTAQKGLCALCDKVLHKRSKQGCHVDHDHVTMRFRGLLCGTCNTGLGFLGDTPETLERAVRYVRG